jgi:hypothetical protein
VRRRRIDQVAIVDGTMVPTRDHRLAAPSKNYRYSANLQVAVDADARLLIAIGDPQPGNLNDCTVYRTYGINQKLAGRPVMADGGYKGNSGVITPYRKRPDGNPWQTGKKIATPSTARFAPASNTRWRAARNRPA